MRPQPQLSRALAGPQRHGHTAAPGLFHHLRHQPGRIDHGGFLQRRPPHEGEEFVDQTLHILDIALQGADLGIFGQQRQAQLHPGQGPAQIVTDTRQHQGALFDLAFDAGAHVQKGGAGGPHLQRTARLVGQDLAAAKRLCRARHPGDRHQLVAQKGKSNRRHQDRGKAHHHQQLVRIAG